MALNEQVALVTGASRGIGKAIALALGRKRAIVVGTATSEKGAEDISAYLRDHDMQGMGLCMNVTDQDSIDKALDAIAERYSAPSILVNNAGITRDNLMLRMKQEEWDDIIDTNLTSVYRMSKACLRQMVKARHGRIVNIASVVGVTGNPGQANYAAAKAGMIGFAKSLAREVGGRGITVNVVAPGFIDTDMTRQLEERQREALAEQIPLGRLGAADDIGEAVAFLVSPSAAYITGETLHVNGGMYMP
ncbi:MAG: 3-oxoacyl-ACP reductase FabG [Gammaproteobacteria bacterium]|nr:3-oxoacyl-ACP reductase FabG [Gammaproteobacteria bacterium]